MSINYQHKIIADVRCSGIHLQEGIGFYLLRFSIYFDVKAHKDQVKPFRFEHVRLRVYAGLPSSQKLLGYAEPEAPIFIQTQTDYSSSTQLLFDVSVSPTQLGELESIRNGGDLHFKLHLFGESYGTHDPLPAHDDINVPVNQTEWIKLLNQANFADIVLFEIHLPASIDAGAFRVAVDHLRKARDRYLAGHYDESIGKCRLAIDNFAKVQADEPQANVISAFCKDRNEMGVNERLLLLRAAVKHYTQLAHHDLTTDSTSNFNRADAGLILGMTAGLLAHVRSKS